jgi:tellurium resistance protein TerZ
MTVSLSKGQGVSLAKSDGSSLSRVHMGLGWSAAKGLFGRAKAIDLDASCMVFNADHQLVDQVWFQQLTSRDGAIQHTGDDLTGSGRGDNESIVVDLARVTPEATCLVFVVNSFSGQDFSKIKNAFCRLVDLDANSEFARFDLSESGPYTAQIMAKVQREGSGWQMTAIGAPCSGQTFKDLLPTTLPYL